MIKIAYLIVIMALSGCSHSQYVRDVYTNGQRVEHSIISNTQVLYWSEFKDVSASTSDIQFTIGKSEKNPEVSEVMGLVELWMKGTLL